MTSFPSDLSHLSKPVDPSLWSLGIGYFNFAPRHSQTVTLVTRLVALPTLYSGWKCMKSSLNLHGRARLAKITTGSMSEDAAVFLGDCNDYHFLDFIELIFKWQRLWEFNINPHELLKNVNEFLEVDDLPYYLTEFVFSRPESPKSGLPPGVGVFQSSTQIETYPQIIRRDNEAIHETAIQPALTLLANPAFASANKEFLEALARIHRRRASG